MTLRPSPSVLFQPLADGGVLFCTHSEVYFNLNAQAARIWHLVADSDGDLDSLLRDLSGRYPDIPVDTLRRDARHFLAELTSAGLLEA